ncbi:MAG TPA: lysozyme inhibitor LprI family protein [Rhodanobacteraceae bacterium]|nr:lysozyme inhibitor LprI family protein [Rhodanobacteraceae bacterium]
MVTVSAATAVPAGLLGQWQVIQVAVDGSDQPHWLYFPNDPRLLGRLLTVDQDVIQRADGSLACKSPTFAALPTETLQHFIGRNFRRPPAYETPPLPTLADFDLHLPNVAVSPLQIHCKSQDPFWDDTWWVLTGNRMLIGKPGGPDVLVLRRLSPHEPIRASFDCAKASSVVEKTICDSRALATYDRSVAAAYRGRLLRTDKPRAVIQKAQRRWLKTRDACGANAACLEQSMRQRVDDLMQQW